MAGLTASRAKVTSVVAFAGATPFVLPIGAEGLVVLPEEQFASDVFGNGLVKAVPGGGSVAFEDPVGEAPEAYGAGGERVSACARLKTRLAVGVKGGARTACAGVGRIRASATWGRRAGPGVGWAYRGTGSVAYVALVRGLCLLIRLWQRGAKG